MFFPPELPKFEYDDDMFFPKELSQIDLPEPEQKAWADTLEKITGQEIPDKEKLVNELAQKAQADILDYYLSGSWLAGPQNRWLKTLKTGIKLLDDQSDIARLSREAISTAYLTALEKITGQEIPDKEKLVKELSQIDTPEPVRKVLDAMDTGPREDAFAENSD